MKPVRNTLGPAPIRVGMAGVIHLESSPGDSMQHERIRRVFDATHGVHRTEWQSDDLFVLSQDCDGPHGESLPAAIHLPVNGRWEGLVFGQFFESPQGGESLRTATVAALASYAEQGDRALDAINGAWAAVLWDRRSRQACFARDALGIQTLYVAASEKEIVFSTDLRTFRLMDWPVPVDEQALAEFLHYLYVPAPRTAFQGITAVLPGHTLRVRPHVQQTRYATPRFVPGPAIDEREVKERIAQAMPLFEQHLLTAVSNCLPTKGRVALALSGGKDSSTLAIALSKLCPDRVLAFNVGSPHRPFDESADAALVARALGLEFCSYMPDAQSLGACVEPFLRIQDQPVGDPAALPYFMALSRLPDDCSVVLDGTGNDYYFGIPSVAKGVHRYGMRVKWQRQLPDPVWRGVLRMMRLGPSWMRQLHRHWSAPVEETFTAWDAWSTEGLEDLYERPISFEDTVLWSAMREGSPEQWLELLTSVVCGIWEPHAAYRKSVQFANGLGRAIRFPFTDLRLAKFVHSLPLRLKVEGSTNKILLRAYMARWLPQEVLLKPKAPFAFDIGPLLANDFHWLGTVSARELVRDVAAWNAEAVSKVIERFDSHPSESACQYRLYTLALVAALFALSDNATAGHYQTVHAGGGR